MSSSTPNITSTGPLISTIASNVCNNQHVLPLGRFGWWGSSSLHTPLRKCQCSACNGSRIVVHNFMPWCAYTSYVHGAVSTHTCRNYFISTHWIHSTNEDIGAADSGARRNVNPKSLSLFFTSFLSDSRTCYAHTWAGRFEHNICT